MIDEQLPISGYELQRIALRALLVLIAVGFAAVGFTLLTAPVWIPITIGLWMGAAALIGLAAFWEPNGGM